MFTSLTTSYSMPSSTFSRDQMLKRHNDIPALAAEFVVFRDRVDRLVQTEVLFNDREKLIDTAIGYLGKLKAE